MDIALEMTVIDCPRYVLAMPRGEIDAHTEPVFRLARAGEIVPLCPTIQEAVWCVVPLTDEEIASWS